MSKELKITEEQVRKLYSETKCDTVRSVLKSLFGDTIEKLSKKPLLHLTDQSQLGEVRRAFNEFRDTRYIHLSIRTSGNFASQGLFLGNEVSPSMKTVKDNEGAWVLIPNED